jgi:hypothetical protein
MRSRLREKEFARRVTLTSASAFVRSLCSAVQYFRANAIPGRLVMETGGFLGIIAACPKPVLGLPYSVVRLPPLFRGVSFYSIKVV